MKNWIWAGVLAVAASAAWAEVTVVDGVKYECINGICRIVDDDFDEEEEADAAKPAPVPASVAPARLSQGYQEADAFLAFLDGRAAPEEAPFAGKALWFVALLALLGGLAMNLTPCVLPMIPINLIVIGKSAARGAWYGLGVALAYGTLGLLAAVGGMAFGTIQGSPWFNFAVAAVFVALGLSLCGVFFLDFSRLRGRVGPKTGGGNAVAAFFLGALSAVLAGACVAPVLISVLLLTAKLYAEGRWLALGLPFALGLGMALPWPLLGAGMRVLPKPGAWMAWVNRAFAAVVFGFAAWYAVLGWRGLARADGAAASGTDATPADFPARLAEAKRPVLVDCWATWCKNCAAMERGTLREARVAARLKGFTVIRLQAEDIRALRALPGFGEVQGLPAFAIFE